MQSTPYHGHDTHDHCSACPEADGMPAQASKAHSRGPWALPQLQLMLRAGCAQAEAVDMHSKMAHNGIRRHVAAWAPDSVALPTACKMRASMSPATQIRPEQELAHAQRQQLEAAAAGDATSGLMRLHVHLRPAPRPRCSPGWPYLGRGTGADAAWPGADALPGCCP